MAVPVVVNTQSTVDGANATSRNVTTPTGSGGWLIAGSVMDLTTNINAPTGGTGGWTEFYARTDSDGSSNMKLWKRLADGTEGANINFTTGSEIGTHFVTRITGCDATDCIGLFSDWSGTADIAGTTEQGFYPPVYNEYVDSLILRITGWDNGSMTITNPSGHTEILNQGGNSSGTRMQACYKSAASAGYEDGVGFTISNAAELGSAVTIVIRSTSTKTLPTQPYVANGSYCSSDGSATNALTYQKPYGTVDGDLLIMAQSSDTTGVLSNPPTNFTNIRNTLNSTVWHRVDYRVASSEGSSYTGSSSTSNSKIGALLRIVGADTSAPIDTSSQATGTSAAPTAGTITPSVNNCLLMWTAACDDSRIDFQSGHPSTWTPIWMTSNEEGLNVGLGIAVKEQTTAAATGSIAGTMNASDDWIAFAIAIKPAASSNGVGTSAGTCTVTAVGKAEKRGVGSVSGTCTAVAVGRALFRAVGTTAGTSTVAATGRAIARAVGTAAGTSTVAATSKATKKAVATTAGTSNVSAVGKSLAAANGTANGAATASGIGSAHTEGIGTAAGTSTVAAVGRAGKRIVGTVSGASTAAAVGKAEIRGVGTSSGSATPSAVGAAKARAVGSAAGVASVSGVSGGSGSTTGTAAGSCTVTGVGRALFKGVATAAGSSTVNGVASGQTYAGSSAGTSTAAAVGKSLARAAASTSGTGTASGVAKAQGRMVGSTAGTSTASATSKATKQAAGSAAGTSTATAVGKTVKKTAGSTSGSSTASAVGRARVPAVGTVAGSSAANGTLKAEARAVGQAAGSSTVIGYQASTGIITPEQRALSIESRLLTNGLTASMITNGVIERIVAQDIEILLTIISTTDG